MSEREEEGATTPRIEINGGSQIKNSGLDWALAYSRVGWAVFPCHTIVRGVCTCGKGASCSAPGKHPRTTDGSKSATTDEAKIRAMWSRWPDANVAVNVGMSGLLVVDVDVKSGGFASRDELPFDLPPTLTAVTGGAGRHYVYAKPDADVIRGRQSWRPGIDIKTSMNDYIIVSPSLHIKGSHYIWEDWDVQVVSAPPDLVESLRSVEREVSGQFDFARVLSGLPEGNRDDGLFRAACLLRNRLDNDRGLVETTVLELAARCSPPFDREDALRKVDQAFMMEREQLAPGLVEWAQNVGQMAQEGLLATMRSLLLSPDDLDSLPDPEWLIDGVMAKSSLAVLYGSPGLGKTFLALDWALRIGVGLPWMERDVAEGGVLYVYAEGVHGLKQRRTAWTQHTGVAGPFDVKFYPRAVPLLERDHSDALAELSAELGVSLVVIDTLARATAGADENSVKDMGRAVAASDAIRERSGASVLLVHHTGKDGLNYRGSSSIEGAADAMLHLAKTDAGSLELRCAKQKDAEPFDAIPLILESVGPSAVLTPGVSVNAFVEDQANAQMLAILGRHPQTWLSATDVGDEAGMKVKRTVSRRLNALWEGGVIERQQFGQTYKFKPKWTP